MQMNKTVNSSRYWNQSTIWIYKLKKMKKGISMTWHGTRLQKKKKQSSKETDKNSTGNRTDEQVMKRQTLELPHAKIPLK